MPAKVNFLWRWSLLFAWGGTILYFSLDPSPPVPKTGFLAYDKFQHAAAYAVLTFLGGISSSSMTSNHRKGWGAAASLSVLYGGLMELAQWGLTTSRTAELGDIVADGVGAGVVCVIAILSRQGLRAHRSRGASMGFIIAIIVAFMLSVSIASASDPVFANLSSTRSEASRLVAEVRDVAASPFDMEHGGIWKTAGVLGAAGLLYVFDSDIRDSIKSNKSRGADKAADAASVVGNPYVHLGAAALVYAGGVAADSAKYRDVGLMLGEAALLADAATFVLKEATGRARPFVGGDKGSFRPFQFRNDYDSLPSAHTASSFAMASIISATSDSVPVALLSYGTAFFVGFSRMYDDKHWASDVIIAAAIGELCGRVVIRTHVAQGTTLRVAPVVSNNAMSLAMIGTW